MWRYRFLLSIVLSSSVSIWLSDSWKVSWLQLNTAATSNAVEQQRPPDMSACLILILSSHHRTPPTSTSCCLWFSQQPWHAPSTPTQSTCAPLSSSTDRLPSQLAHPFCAPFPLLTRSATLCHYTPSPPPRTSTGNYLVCPLHIY